MIPLVGGAQGLRGFISFFCLEWEKTVGYHLLYQKEEDTKKKPLSDVSLLLENIRTLLKSHVIHMFLHFLGVRLFRAMQFKCTR